jgi:alanine transaminase
VNPGNPTGQVMDKSSLKDVVRFCVEKDIVLIADEVYQENIWAAQAKFHSFKRIAAEEGLLGKVQLASLHSVSKGYYGECGRRGGYVEMSGFDAGVKETMYKMASVNLCSNVDGQLTVGLLCRPPVLGDESFPLFDAERASVLQSLKRRASLVGSVLSSAPGMSCVVPEGALYAFPSVVLPDSYVRRHAANPDEAYCIQLLEETGVVVVPGSGFGQRDGTHHFRVTLLPPEETLPGVLQSIVDFHKRLVEREAAAA